MRRVALLATAAGLLAGCGGESGDLMAIDVSGGVAADRGPLAIVVTGDGRGHCNDGPRESIPSELVIEARELERELDDLAQDGASFEGQDADRASYVLRIKAGTVRWTEGAPGLPKELARAQLYALALDRRLCR